MFVVRSGRTVIVHAPAKLNLHLEILARRDDGYHELETLMTTAQVFDTVEFTSDQGAIAIPGEIHVECQWALGRLARLTSSNSAEPLPPARENIVYRAILALRDKAGLVCGARIKVIKRIPTCAGLGGASSDGAAALLAANEAWNLGWSVDRLAEMGLRAGVVLRMVKPGQPCILAIDNHRLSFRCDEAAAILVEVLGVVAT